MGAKDRLGNWFFIGAAVAAWIVVAQIVSTTYPRESATSGLMGAGMIGLACGLTSVPLFWLVPFARHRRIALLGDWSRAIRREMYGFARRRFLAARRSPIVAY